MRKIVGKAIVPVMKVTGFRFSKNYRWGTSIYHRIVYTLVDTIGANIRAGL